MLALLQCPATRWALPATSERPTVQRDRGFLVEIECPVGEDEYEFMAKHAPFLMELLNDAGALHFRGWNLPTTKVGFRRWASTLKPLQPCEDPLTSIGVRKLLSPQDGVYEAVNSEALAQTFIGLHNDATYKLTAPYAAFVCFRRADSGGEFLVCDGRAVLSELSPTVLSELCRRKVSIRVAALNLDAILSRCGESLQRPIRQIIEGAVGALIGVAIPLDLQLAWDSEGTTLQILEQPKSPTNCHPVSGQPSFFSSLHSQARHLQERRAAVFSATAPSSVASTDAFYGDDLAPIPPADLEHIDDVISRMTRRVAMEPGDVVLLDSYQVLHGRDVFEGEREHGVLWFAG
jgi:hypothetical protein